MSNILDFIDNDFSNVISLHSCVVTDIENSVLLAVNAQKGDRSCLRINTAGTIGFYDDSGILIWSISDADLGIKAGFTDGSTYSARFLGVPQYNPEGNKLYCLVTNPYNVPEVRYIRIDTINGYMTILSPAYTVNGFSGNLSIKSAHSNNIVSGGILNTYYQYGADDMNYPYGREHPGCIIKTDVATGIITQEDWPENTVINSYFSTTEDYDSIVYSNSYKEKTQITPFLDSMCSLRRFGNYYYFCDEYIGARGLPIIDVDKYRVIMDKHNKKAGYKWNIIV